MTNPTVSYEIVVLKTMSKYLESASLPPLGAICLDYTDDIHRPPGDPLNPESFDFPLIHEIVPNATLWNVVKQKSTPKNS